ncbi:MAG: ester cyclase [Crocosphaera sp.]
MSLFDTAQEFFTALNAQEMDKVVSLISPSANIVTPIGNFTGGEAYRDWMNMHFRALPNFTHELRGMVAESERTLAFELHAFGTHTGPLDLPSGTIEATNKSLDVSAVDFWQFDENGLIVEYHLYFNLMDFLGQLGLA